MITIWTLEDAKKEHVDEPILARILNNLFEKHSGTILDFGCGKGYYLNEIQKLMPNRDLIALEGTPNIEEISYFKPIKQQDLGKKFILKRPSLLDKRKKDLIKGNVLCLEVAEHIDPQYEEVFVENLINHTFGLLIISWAIPDQAGYGHNNCKSNQDVITLIESKSKELINPLKFNKELTEKFRSELQSAKSWWFKNTIMVFNTI